MQSLSGHRRLRPPEAPAIGGSGHQRLRPPEASRLERAFKDRRVKDAQEEGCCDFDREGERRNDEPTKLAGSDKRENTQHEAWNRFRYGFVRALSSLLESLLRSDVTPLKIRVAIARRGDAGGER